MPAIPPIQAIAAKWSRVTPARAEDYRNGVQNPRVDWATATANAEAAWRDGVTQAATQGRFAAAVRRHGTQKWQTRTLAKGPGRFAEGVSMATDDYAQGFGPYRDVIERTQLPPRGPKGDPRNIERVRVMAAALRNAKTQSTGTTRP